MDLPGCNNGEKSIYAGSAGGRLTVHAPITRRPGAGASTNDLGELGTFQGQVVHQPFVAEYKTHNRILNIGSVN